MSDALPRLTPLRPDPLDPAARKLYDAVLEGPRGQGPGRRIIVREDGSLTGPFDAWLRSPELGHHLERVGMSFRTDTTLSPAAREVTVLVVAKAWGAAFEWTVHKMLARMNGVPDAVIEEIAHGRRPECEEADCAAAHDVAAELVHGRAVTDATFARAREALGERALVECVTLVGFYQLVSGVLETFRPPPPSGDVTIEPPPAGSEIAEALRR